MAELLGLDPLQMACEGRFIAFVPEDQAARALEILRRDEACADARRIGAVVAAAEENGGTVELVTTLGVLRALDLPTGVMLPRIC